MDPGHPCFAPAARPPRPAPRAVRPPPRRRLFPNLNVDDVAVDLTNTEDPDADDAGAPFTQVEHNEEWVDWVDWGAVDASTAGAGGSSSA